MRLSGVGTQGGAHTFRPPPTNKDLMQSHLMAGVQSYGRPRRTKALVEECASRQYDGKLHAPLHSAYSFAPALTRSYVLAHSNMMPRHRHHSVYGVMIRLFCLQGGAQTTQGTQASA